MSQGSIKNRIDQNNNILEDVVDVVEDLPDYLDTSDATATSGDLVEGKTAYVDGEKITGVMQVLSYPYPYSEYGNYDYEFYTASSAKQNVVRDNTSYVLLSYQVVPNDQPDTWALTGNRKMKMGVTYSRLATAIGLTANKIRKNITILGITGTYSGSIDLTTGVKFAYSDFSTMPSSIANANWEDIKNMSFMFSDCSSLSSIPLIDTSNVEYMVSTFQGCNITSVPQLDTSSAIDMNGMFSYCDALVSVPVLNTSNVTCMENMFDGCALLSNASLNNILEMCTNAVNYAYTKELSSLGLSEDQTDICESLSNWSACQSAGWSTGY